MGIPIAKAARAAMTNEVRYIKNTTHFPKTQVSPKRSLTHTVHKAPARAIEAKGGFCHEL